MIIQNSPEDFVHDDAGNRASITNYGTREKALEALVSNKGCKNCLNCTNCSDCIGCRGCNNCTNCIDCMRCKECIGCKECWGANSLVNEIGWEEKFPANWITLGELKEQAYRQT